jgi:SulP family sulfate permease
VIIFRLKDVPFMDVTGLQSFQEIIEQLQGRNINVLVCEASPRVLYKLERMNILSQLYKGQVFPTLITALEMSLPKEQ